MESLKAQIKTFLKGEAEDDAETLDQYSRDYSIFRVRPSLVVFPKDAEDVENLVKFANSERKKGQRVSLTGRAGGTDMTGGPLNHSIIIEFKKYFNKIKELSDDYARVEPGVYFRDFEKELKKKNLMFPPYPASKDICAIGGMLANNSGGEKSLAYGKTEDYVEELKAVLSDGKEHILKPLSKEEFAKKLKEKSFEGELYRKIWELIDKNEALIKNARPDVSKNSAGYAIWKVWDGKVFDITKLIIGSQGTLGIITEAKLRLVSAKKYHRLSVVFVNDMTSLADLILALLKFKPESLESYDDKTFRLAIRFLPGIIKFMKGGFLKLVFQFLPEFWMVIKGGIPKMIILVELASDDKNELDSRLTALKTMVSELGFKIRMTRNELEAEKYLTIRRQSFKLLHSYVTDKETAPFIDDFIVRPEYLPEFFPKLNRILERYKDKLIYTIAGHPGDGNFHIIPLMDLKDEKVRAIIPELSEEVYDLVLQYKGSITAEHNDGFIRTPYLKKMYGEKMYKIFEEIKAIFDPLGIFNPGKKIGTDIKTAMSYIK